MRHCTVPFWARGSTVRAVVACRSRECAPARPAHPGTAVECCLAPNSTADEETVRRSVVAYLERLGSVVENTTVSVADDPYLSAHIEQLVIGGRTDNGAVASLLPSFVCAPRPRSPGTPTRAPAKGGGGGR